MTAQARTTARQVKTISKPKTAKEEPIGPCRPKSMSNTSPVATGGTKNGSITSVSTTAFPASRRAINQAMRIPNGRIISVLRAETLIVKKTICHASAVMASMSHFVTMNPNFSKDLPRGCGPARYWANFFALSGSLEDFSHRDRVGNLRPFRSGNFDSDFYLLRDHRVGLVNKAASTFPDSTAARAARTFSVGTIFSFTASQSPAFCRYSRA